MRRKKFVKFCLILILLLGITWCIFCNIADGSSSDPFVQYARKSYDYAVNHIDEYSALRVTNVFSNYAYNIPCMYLSQNTNLSSSLSGVQELIGYALISSDGTVNVYTYNANTKTSTLSKTITNLKEDFQNAARMCYYVTMTDGGVNYYINSSYFNGKTLASGDTSGTWYNLIGWYNQYASTLGWSTSWTSGDNKFGRKSLTLSNTSGPWNLAVANPENITCEAIILYYATHGQQSTIMCLGKLGSSEPSINKYITETDNGTYDRDEYSETKKTSNPVSVYPLDTITYEIYLDNPGSTDIEEIKVTDTFDSEYLEFVSGTTLEGWSDWKRIAAELIQQKVIFLLVVER